ncbi:MAG: serine/threonine protein kinase [Gemmatimonadales bacterium]|nr:serine/threonine protein kinase [Gemmatimonadales bacterium]MBP6572498.1 serine/threonine protein kinase [Gemmatimonadales bacterium]MBP7619517.1 serine/threonine protein kinase [Gemmatimonadales bacterium]
MTIDVATLQARLTASLHGELEVLGVLGVGGFGAVFRAHDPVLGRDVAIKVLDPAGGLSDAARDRFLQEARVVATVEHPHIVPLYAAEVRDGLLCLTMRMVPGRSLADRLAAERRLEPGEAARVAHEVAQALAAAHARGVVHRDVKPENILLDADGHAIVTDFGISLVTGRASERTPGMAIGTPQYLSPEQALGEDVDGRADVYSLGVMLYEMLAGRLPFTATTTAGLLAKQILETPPPLAEQRTEVPTALVTAVEHAMAKSPSARPDGKTFAAELAAARTPDALLPPAAVKRRRRWRRIRLMAVIGVTAAIALGFGFWVIVQLFRGFSGGVLPDLSAVGSSVPPALLEEARADGSLQADELVRYAFVPGNSAWNEGLLLTKDAVIRRTPQGPRRHPLGDLSINLYFNGKTRGLIILDPATGVPDTLYRSLSGAELGALTSALAIARDTVK